MLDVMMVKMVMELSNLVQPLNGVCDDDDDDDYGDYDVLGMKQKYFYGRKQQQKQQQRNHKQLCIVITSTISRTFHFWPLAVVSRKILP